VAARRRAHRIHGAAPQRENAGADRAYLENRQAAPQLVAKPCVACARKARFARESNMTRQLEDAYIVAAARTPVGQAPRGALPSPRPASLLAHVLKSVLTRVPSLDPVRVEDVTVGCAMPEGEQGMNVARIGVLLAGLPNSVAGMTINRFCSSGLNAVS